MLAPSLAATGLRAVRLVSVFRWDRLLANLAGVSGSRMWKALAIEAVVG